MKYTELASLPITSKYFNLLVKKIHIKIVAICQTAIHAAFCACFLPIINKST